MDLHNHIPTPKSLKTPTFTMDEDNNSFPKPLLPSSSSLICKNSTFSLRSPARYRECLRNHAASLGGHILDGCGEFMASGDPMKCAACSCHRSFHRREGNFSGNFSGQNRGRIFQKLSESSSEEKGGNGVGKKRIRTKFSGEQKERMMGFAERIGWRMQRKDDEEMERFCADVGVSRQVFKVWMHNNKNAVFKRPEQGQQQQV